MTRRLGFLSHGFGLVLLVGLIFPVQAENSASSAAVSALLKDAHEHYTEERHEQAAALLERALRIEPRNPVLWHNLAGVRLQQEDFARALSLAAKSNSFAVDNRMLRIRNWVVITLACEGLKNEECAREARKRSHLLAGQ